MIAQLVLFLVSYLLLVVLCRLLLGQLEKMVDMGNKAERNRVSSSNRESVKGKSRKAKEGRAVMVRKKHTMP